MKHIEELFADYLEGKLRLDELEDFFMRNPSSRAEFLELKQLYEEIPREDPPAISDRADEAFYANLRRQKKHLTSGANGRIISFTRTALKYAAVLLAVGAAYFLGTRNKTKEVVTIEKPTYITQAVRDTIFIDKELSPKNKTKAKKTTPQPEVMDQLADIRKEIDQMNEVQQKMVLAMLRQESAASRLQAINDSYGIEIASNSLINALLQTVETDPSMNVRLAALEAIGRFELSPQVRENMVLTLAHQRDPSLQMALINKLIELKEVKALPVFAGLVNSPNVPSSIKSQAELGIKVLTM